MRWRPPEPPAEIIKIVRDGEEIWTGFPHRVTRSTAAVEVECVEPVALLGSMPFPYPPPGADGAVEVEGFHHWWRQLFYVFELPDPGTFPPLEFGDAERQTLERFARVADHLAASSALSSNPRIQLVPASDDREDALDVRFPPVDVQAGFGVLLRQCHEPNDAASYSRVRKILGRAAHESVDGARDERLAMLDSWTAAAKSLRQRSLRRLVGDAFADREGWEAFRLSEPHTPDELIRIFNYGDLIHWGDRRDDVVGDDSAFESTRQRFAFFVAATGLAHIYIGFAALVRSALRPA